jgi:hypothetical protein
MGSPFVNASSGKLKVITDNGDYKRDKGWELLQRNFGCLEDVTNPYFILYNKYTGMMRVYVYLTAGSYSQLLMTIKSVYNHRPATISTAHDIMHAPDKYFANQAGTSSDEVMVSLTESVATATWAVAEYYMMLDDRIADPIYNNASIEIKIYGVTNSSLEAVVEGSSCTGANCGETIKNGTFKTANANTSGQSFNFTGVGEKLLSFSKSFTDFTTGINKSSKKIADNLYPTTTPAGNLNLLQKFGKLARFVETNTADSADFAKLVSTLGSFAGTAGQVLKFAGSVIGFFQGGHQTSAFPAFTTYNLTVKGSISAQVVVGDIVVNIPGLSTIPTNSNNATYYNCPLGVFNLKNTVTVDTLVYERRAMIPSSYNPKNVPKTIRYATYSVREEVNVVVNAGVGLSVVSVEGALMAKVANPPLTSNPNLVSIGPLENNPVRGYYTYFNHMRADVEANRLEISHYDVDNEIYHILQTPFYSLECMTRATMNIHVPVMKVYLRLRATLKRTDGLGELVYFIKDYEVDKRLGSLRAIPTDISTNVNSLPPYANYSIPPNTTASIDINNGNVYPTNQDLQLAIFNDFTYAAPVEINRNHSISNSPNYYTRVTSTQPTVIFRAGSSVTLGPKFEATYGSVFLATVNWGDWAQNCYPSASITNFVGTNNCYNNIISSQKQRAAKFNIDDDINVYPNPASQFVTVSIDAKEEIKQIKMVDISGKPVPVNRNTSSRNIVTIDISSLSAGQYLITIISETNTRTRKLTVLR